MGVMPELDAEAEVLDSKEPDALVRSAMEDWDAEADFAVSATTSESEEDESEDALVLVAVSS